MRASFASFTYKRFLGSVIRAAKQLTYTECFPPKKEHQHQTGKKHSNRQDAGHLIVSTIGWQKVAIRLWLWRDAGHQSDVDVVQWHPNSHYVATGSSDRSIRLWDIRDASIARVFVGHRSPVSHPAALSLMQITCRNAICNVMSGTICHKCDWKLYDIACCTLQTSLLLGTCFLLAWPNNALFVRQPAICGLPARLLAP